MNTDAIIKQLEKALAKKDDKELRLRVEVLVDILKESKPLVPTPMSVPIQPRLGDTPISKPTITSQPKINGPGAIVGGGEQINYTRPEGT